MSRYPYGHDELDRNDAELDEVAHRLERYADGRRGEPPVGLAARIHAAIGDEPDPARGWWQSLIAGPRVWPPMVRTMAAAGVATLAVVGAVAVAQLMGDVGPNVGASPSPQVIDSPSQSPSVSPSPTASPSPSPSPSPTPTVAPTSVPTAPPASSPSPTATDDDDDDDETPEPSESDDDSGSGGGGGDGDD